MRIVSALVIAIAFAVLAQPARACLLNSWCSNSYSNEYNSSSCTYQRSSCDSERYRNNGTPAAPRRSFGAIAYSVSSGSWGYSENYGSRAEAQTRAMRECRTSDCEVAAWFYNSCGALAADEKNGSWGAAQGSNVAKAQAGAQARCVKEGGTNCQILFSRCSF